MSSVGRDGLALGGEQDAPEAREVGATGAAEVEVDQRDRALPLALARRALPVQVPATSGAAQVARVYECHEARTHKIR